MLMNVDLLGTLYDVADDGAGLAALSEGIAEEGVNVICRQLCESVVEVIGGLGCTAEFDTATGRRTVSTDSQCMGVSSR
jgi:hypothetical protein